MRNFSLIDKVIVGVNDALATIFSTALNVRDNPAKNITDVVLTPNEQKKSIGLMRVNHTGEVCAQALYRGQLAFSHTEKTCNMLQKSCEEETDHLAWTKNRLAELNGRTSYLNFLWYVNSYLIGAIAGFAGDQWSLGFVSETEIQVAKHLENHLEKLPQADLKSRAIVLQMREEEMQHTISANRAGACELPFVIKKLMQLQSKIMTTVAFYL